MRHYAGQLRFVVASLDGSQVYVDREAWNCKGVDLLLIDHMKAVRPLLSRCVRHQLQPQLLHVFADGITVGKNRKLLADLSRSLLPIWISCWWVKASELLVGLKRASSGCGAVIAIASNSVTALTGKRIAGRILISESSRNRAKK